jgi:3-dehydroquinate synthase
MPIRVHLDKRSYDIILNARLADFGPFARKLTGGSLALVVTDQNILAYAEKVVASLRGGGFQTELAALPPGEAQKSLATASQLYDRLADLHADRKTAVVAVGGGVVGDLAGFVAATFARGLPLLMVPTTLLAMVDSSVGGKVAVNHARAKNLIGAFHQPSCVWIELSALDTLPEREYRSGLAEVVKYAMSLDANFLEFLERNVQEILQRNPQTLVVVVDTCCKLKAAIVKEDEREETGLRMVLNYGHTFAHAFETVAGYGQWLHGEAVAAGMVCASRLAERRGSISAELTERLRHLLARFGLPTAPEPWPVSDLVEAMRSDKKALAGRMRFILPRRLGEVALFDDVPETEVRRVLEEAVGRDADPDPASNRSGSES